MIFYFYPTTSSTSTTFGTIINQQWFTDHLLWVQLSGELAMVICVLQMKQRSLDGLNNWSTVSPLASVICSF